MEICIFLQKLKTKKEAIRYYDKQINTVFKNLHVDIKGLEKPKIVIVDKSLSPIEIMEKLKENSYNLVDELNKKGYNIRKEISEYANESSFTKPEEVYVEIFVKKYFERRK